MAFGLAVYASQCGLPPHHARLASGCWSGSTGRAFHPHGSDERFQSCYLHLILLSQASSRKGRVIVCSERPLSVRHEAQANSQRSAKLPGPPARTLKPENPGWRPRSASVVGYDYYDFHSHHCFTILPLRTMATPAQPCEPMPAARVPLPEFVVGLHQSDNFSGPLFDLVLHIGAINQALQTAAAIIFIGRLATQYSAQVGITLDPFSRATRH